MKHNLFSEKILIIMPKFFYSPLRYKVIGYIRVIFLYFWFIFCARVPWGRVEISDCTITNLVGNNISNREARLVFLRKMKWRTRNA